MLRDKFDIKVPIREQILKCLIFGLQARLPIATILSYMGYRHDVIWILQTLSHTTRAYIWNANGLEAFIKPLNIINFFRDSEEQGFLEDIAKWQLVQVSKKVANEEDEEYGPRLRWMYEKEVSDEKFIETRLATT